jgi:hypothetical protein
MVDVNAIAFTTNNSERMRIISNGNVGIGTTSPSAKLELYMASGGSNALRLNTNFASGNYIDLNPYISGVSNGGFELSQNGTQRLVVSSVGNVGIGVTNPANKLETYLADGVNDNNFIIRQGSNNFSSNIVLAAANNTGATYNGIMSSTTSGTEHWRIDAGGVVDSLAFTTGGGGGGIKMRISPTGDVGINVNVPTQRLHVVGNARITGGIYDSSNAIGTSGQVLSSTGTGTAWIAASAGTVTGSGTTNYVTKFTGATSLGNSLIYDNGSSVGIGSTTTSISGTTFRTVVTSGDTRVMAFNGDGFASVWWNGSGTPQFAIDSMSGGGAAFWVNNGGWAERMRLTSTGDFGIGTSSPSGKLDVYGDGYFGKQDYSYQAIQKVLTLRGDPVSGVYAQNSYRFYTTPGALNSAQKLSIRAEYAGSESSDLMTILGNGNVGIGTTSPGGQLDVYTNAYKNFKVTYPSIYATQLNFGTAAYTSYDAGSATLSLFATDASYGSIALGAGGSEKMRIIANGNVGIGTTSPSAKLDINGNARVYGSNLLLDFSGNVGGIQWGLNPYIQGVANGGFEIKDYTSNVSRVVISSTGNVGIGTTSPGEKLQVAGNIAVDTLELNTPKKIKFNANRTTLGTYGDIEWYNYQWDGLIKASIGGETNGTLASGTIVFKASSGGSNATEKMRITGAGNVGIGTTSPGASLDVQGTFNASNSGAALNVSSSQAYAGYQGNYDYSSAGASYSSINSNDGQSFIQSYSAAYGRSPKLGIQAYNSNTGDQDFLVAKHLIQNSYTPTDTSAPVKWIRIWDEDTGAFFFIPMYQ